MKTPPRRKPAPHRRPAHKRPAGRALAVAEPPVREEVLPRAEEWAEVPCPHCGELIEVLVGADEDGGTRFEDCSVCCQTVSLHVTWDDGELLVEAARA
ncbi:MAG: CPXCG motif-containing cysteine-rich protein [Elusimicrobia bacterium]|nr:CPXCG motif-containing cysteine-rich protein [Elusimicrobiota bacterium]